MRRMALVLFVGLCPCYSFTQGYYPLQVGNLWQYQSTELGSIDRWETRILGDTILPNSKTYSNFDGTNFGTRFLRQEGSRVYGYSVGDSSEFVLFDFSANVGDTMSRVTNPASSIVFLGQLRDSIYHRKSWVFSLIFGSGAESYTFAQWTITDSLGLTYLFGEPGIGYRMTGALVDSVLYGTITGFQRPQSLEATQPILLQNYPNPFNPTTVIPFEVGKPTMITVDIYSALGQHLVMLANSLYLRGRHTVVWNAARFPSGTYFCRFTASGFSQTKRLTLIR